MDKDRAEPLKQQPGSNDSLGHNQTRRRLAGTGASTIVISYVDLAGVTRSKPLVNTDMRTALKTGFKTARANLDMNVATPLTPGTRLDISQGDVSIIPDRETLVFPPYAPGTARMIGDIYESDGRVSPLCTRSLLKRTVRMLKASGFSLRVGLESEFHLVKFEGEKVVPADTSGIQTLDGYNRHRSLLERIVKALSSVGVRPVKAHAEGGRGQIEIDLEHRPALQAADGYAYFKEVVKAESMRDETLASFMPKIGADWWGSGLHVHFSLWDKKGGSAFASKRDMKKLGLSPVCCQFIGGVLKHARALSAVGCPTVNSYKRLLPGRWNTDAVTYGPGNRGAAIRIPEERGGATRIELRTPDNSCNLYLLLSCVIAAGMEGIEKKSDPGVPITFDASKMTDREREAKGLRLMPRSLGEAISEFERDKLFKQTMGNELFEEFLVQRYFEVSQAADQVTPWEVSHFLDLF
jgi:glutamine synthetase